MYINIYLITHNFIIFCIPTYMYILLASYEGYKDIVSLLLSDNNIDINLSNEYVSLYTFICIHIYFNTYILHKYIYV